MHILLINTNPVVSRLIALCSREDGMMLEEMSHANNVSRDRYDVMFVDEASYTDETRKVLSTLMVKKTVYLTSKNETNEHLSSFDKVIKKPFLPSTIIEVLESVEDEAVEDSEELASMFPLTSDDEENEEVTIPEEELVSEELMSEEMINELKVLDSNEIEKIKILLEMEEELETVKDKLDEVTAEESEVTDFYPDVEESGEEDLVETVVEKAKKSSVRQREEEHAVFEETLLEAIERMKVKKIKKLLKGAEVTITIKFKDED